MDKNKKIKARKCTKCGIEKPLDEFYRARRERLGVRSECKTCSKAYCNANKEKITAQKKIYRKNNKEKVLAYYKINKNKILARHKIYSNKKYKTNPMFRLNKIISRGIQGSLKSNKNGKHWEDLVGYSIKQLKRHLEKLFTEGMTWKNQGKWHIDHKIPQSVFNFTKPEHKDFKRCWALSNLQPMWAEENYKKNNNLSKLFQPSLLL